ncbi:MAG: hypothetical protein ABIR68_08695 [Ilumatobacteraceae bacterium]
MAFGQSSGPPATAKQLQELLALLSDAGHSDFRDARGPMGFTQRQAGGKFTRSEADEFIEQLQTAGESAGSDGVAPVAPVARTTAAERALHKLPSDQLAAELQRRGWIVIEP